MKHSCKLQASLWDKSIEHGYTDRLKNIGDTENMKIDYILDSQILVKIYVECNK